MTRRLKVARSRGRGVPLDKAPVDPFVAGLKFRETSVQVGRMGVEGPTQEPHQKENCQSSHSLEWGFGTDLRFAAAEVAPDPWELGRTAPSTPSLPAPFEVGESASQRERGSASRQGPGRVWPLAPALVLRRVLGVVSPLASP